MRRASRYRPQGREAQSQSNLGRAKGGHAVGTTPSSPPSGSGLADNIAALLAYLFWPAAIVFLVVEPYNKNKFIRFHAFQELFFCAACIAMGIVFMVLNIVAGMALGALVVVFGLLELVIWLGVVVVWVMLMVKAYQNQMWKLPFIGDLAEKQANG